MRRISSRMTFYYKRILPLIWFGFPVLFVAIPLYRGALAGAMPPLMFIVMPIVVMAFFYFIWKKSFFDLVDEVWDDGDALVIKNRGRDERIALNEIKNVNYGSFSSPQRVTLSLRRPTVFGEEIIFSAPVHLWPFSPNPVVKELINRIDLARRRTN
jgi:hypothetical protein